MIDDPPRGKARFENQASIQHTIPAKIITEMRGADFIVFRID